MLPFWELTPAQRQHRLEQALKLVSEEPARHGIGMQSEKTLHSTLKFYLETDIDFHEIPLGTYIADLYYRDTHEVIEVQTGNFGPLREKLSAFLPQYKVTIVHPIEENKWITRVSDDGELSKPRKSPLKNGLYSILPELYRISSFLNHPNLSFLPILLDLDELRMASHAPRHKGLRIDRTPRAIGESRLLQTPEDFVSILPPLPCPFCAKDLLKAAHFSPRQNSYAISALREMGAIRVVDIIKRAYWYEPLPFSLDSSVASSDYSSKQ